MAPLDMVIRNGHLPDRPGRVDVGVRHGIIAVVDTTVQDVAVVEIDARGGLIAPGLVNGHAHLDKALTADRVPGGPRGIQGLADLQRAIAAMREIKRAFTAEDVHHRAVAAARLAVQGGTSLLRTHADVDPIVGLTGIEGLLAARETCAPWLDMQIVAFPQEGIFRAPGTETLLREALRIGADAIGGIPALDDRPDEHVDLVFQLAREFGCPVDMHVDESDRPEDFTLPYVIERTRQAGMAGRVTVGHISSLAVLPDEVARPTIQALAEAGISVSVNPIVIKITRLRELLDAGVTVMFGSDNLRDPFYPLGNAHPLGTALLACQLGSLGGEADLMRAFDAISTDAARALGVRNYGVAVGRPADLVLFHAATTAQVLLDQRLPRAVLKQGKLQDIA